MKFGHDKFPVLIACCAAIGVPNLAFAGRIDYSRLSFEDMKVLVVFTIVLLSLFALIGILAWVRYLRSYEPSPGTFTPFQALFVVLFFVACTVVFGLFQLGVWG